MSRFSLPLAIATAAALAASALAALPPGPAGPAGPHLGAPASLASTPAGAHGPRRARAERIARFLELSEAQKAAIRDLVEDHRATLEPLLAERRGLREELRGLVERGGQPAEVGRLVLELHARGGELQAARSSLADAIARELVGEQKVKWQHLRELRRAAEGRPRLRDGG